MTGEHQAPPSGQHTRCPTFGFCLPIMWVDASAGMRRRSALVVKLLTCGGAGGAGSRAGEVAATASHAWQQRHSAGLHTARWRWRGECAGSTIHSAATASARSAVPLCGTHLDHGALGVHLAHGEGAPHDVAPPKQALDLRRGAGGGRALPSLCWRQQQAKTSAACASSAPGTRFPHRPDRQARQTTKHSLPSLSLRSL